MKIRQADGTFTLNPQRILKSFQEYYSDLYKASIDANLTQIASFLDGINLPTLTAEHIADLESPITTKEVGEVIRNLKGGSAPGPDGFSVPYYKAFAEILTPYMTRFFNSKKDRKPLGNPLNSAYITVIPKPDKDAGVVGNYRSIYYLFINQQ